MIDSDYLCRPCGVSRGEPRCQRIVGRCLAFLNRTVAASNELGQECLNPFQTRFRGVGLLLNEARNRGGQGTNQPDANHIKKTATPCPKGVVG